MFELAGRKFVEVGSLDCVCECVCVCVCMCVCVGFDAHTL